MKLLSIVIPTTWYHFIFLILLRSAIFVLLPILAGFADVNVLIVPTENNLM